MQYIINSGFVSFASSVNVAILVSMSVMATILPHAWMLHGTAGLCGVLFNCYVFLHSNRKLGFFTKALKKFQLSIEALKQSFLTLKVYFESFMNTTMKKIVLEFLYKQPNMEFLTSYLHSTKRKNSRTLDTTSLVNNKVVKVCTPDMTSSQAMKPVKAQSDPLSRTKLSIKEKYLPAKSPELFKNKIYLTRRNLTNALHD